VHVHSRPTGLIWSVGLISQCRSRRGRHFSWPVRSQRWRPPRSYRDGACYGGWARLRNGSTGAIQLAW